jgi:peptidyl-dipeptidase Dcp
MRYSCSISSATGPSHTFGASLRARGHPVAARLVQLLSIGNTVEPADAYRAFRGRDPKVEALMRKRRFTRK